MSGEDVESLKSRSDARDNWLSGVFDGADINKDGYLDEEESIKLLTVSFASNSARLQLYSVAVVYNWRKIAATF